MAYTPAKTWVGGDVVLATDVQGNLDDLKSYLSKLERSAMKSDTAWVETNHIMRGDYEPIINRAHFVSGVFGGHVHSYPAGMFTYASQYNSGVISTAQRAHVPQTTVDIEVRRPMTVFFQWWAFPFIEDDQNTATGGSAKFFVYWDDPITGTKDNTRQQITDDINDYDSQHRSQQNRMMGGFSMRHITTAGTYALGLSTTTTDVAKCQLVAWGVSFEGFYI
jgi:hypothetical protein